MRRTAFNPAFPQAPDFRDRIRSFGLDASVVKGVGAPFAIWLIGLPASMPAAAWALLSTEERTRARRFHTDRLRRRYVAAHAALRLLCEWQFGERAAEQQFALNEHGKPELLGVRGAQCNLSYSGDHAIVAAAWGRPIGVDIEELRPIADAAELMEDLYTPGERATVHRAQRCGLDTNRAFLRVWVRKEACIKALAKGLSIPLTTVDCGMTSGATTVRFGDVLIRTGVAHVCDHGISAPREVLTAWAQLY